MSSSTQHVASLLPRLQLDLRLPRLRRWEVRLHEPPLAAGISPPATARRGHSPVCRRSPRAPPRLPPLAEGTSPPAAARRGHRPACRRSPRAPPRLQLLAPSCNMDNGWPALLLTRDVVTAAFGAFRKVKGVSANDDSSARRLPIRRWPHSTDAYGEKLPRSTASCPCCLA